MWDASIAIAVFCIFYWAAYSRWYLPPYRDASENSRGRTSEDDRAACSSSSVCPSAAAGEDGGVSRPFSHETRSVSAPDGGDLEWATVSSSHGGGSWTFAIPAPYRYDPRLSAVAARDPCHGLPDRATPAAAGEALRDHYLRKRWDFGREEEEGSAADGRRRRRPVDDDDDATEREARADALHFARRGGLVSFRFLCEGGSAADLLACVPAVDRDAPFGREVCSPLEVCRGRPDGHAAPDPSDRRLYRICRGGRPSVRRCPPDSYFWIDSCRSVRGAEEEALCREATAERTVFPLSAKRYVRCVPLSEREFEKAKREFEKEERELEKAKGELEKAKGELEKAKGFGGGGKGEPPRYRAVVEDCPRNTSILFSWRECRRDACVGHPDGYKKAMPTTDPQSRSSGFYVCRNDGVVKTRWCKDRGPESNPEGSRPGVFDERLQRCVAEFDSTDASA